MAPLGLGLRLTGRSIRLFAWRGDQDQQKSNECGFSPALPGKTATWDESV